MVYYRTGVPMFRSLSRLIRQRNLSRLRESNRILLPGDLAAGKSLPRQQVYKMGFAIGPSSLSPALL